MNSIPTEILQARDEMTKEYINMKCFYCKGDIAESVTTYMTELKNCIVIIKNVPCLKCSQCGEVSFTGATMKKIEAILDKCEGLLTEIAVFNFKDTAA